MNEYNIRQQIAKLQRLVSQYEVDLPRFRSQIATWTAEVDAMAAQAEIQRKQRDGVDPDAFLSGEKALNSNSAALMRSRALQLKEATRALCERSNAVGAAGDKEESSRLYEMVRRWDATYQALIARAAELEKRAEAKRLEERERAERRAERIAGEKDTRAFHRSPATCSGKAK